MHARNLSQLGVIIAVAIGILHIPWGFGRHGMNIRIVVIAIVAREKISIAVHIGERDSISRRHAAHARAALAAAASA